MKKIIAAAALAGVMMLSGCSFFQTNTPTSAIGTYDFSKMELVQLEEPYEGQPMAVIDTSLGTITAVLYPEYAPNTVKNFVDRANEGFYNGKDIYAVVSGTYFMSGAYNEDGTQGWTSDGKKIPNECSVNLWTFKGAFCAYGGENGYGDSRFFVLDNVDLSEEDITQLHSFTNKEGTQLLPDKLIDAFVEKGSVAGAAGVYTVFAQTIEGFDVIDEITNVEINADTARPVEDIQINTVTITEYHSAE